MSLQKVVFVRKLFQLRVVRLDDEGLERVCQEQEEEELLDLESGIDGHGLLLTPEDGGSNLVLGCYCNNLFTS